MIYKFRMISGDQKAFLRDYEIDSNQTFLELHKIIQDNLRFDPTQLASFFLADDNWNKGLELTLIDMDNDGGLAAIPMDSVKVREIIKVKKERLLYVYDIFTDNSFFIELMDIVTPDCAIKYPICTASIGEPPLQSQIQINSGIPLADDLGEDELFDDFEGEDYGFEAEEFEGDEN
jgi:hypothetical protein